MVPARPFPGRWWQQSQDKGESRLASPMLGVTMLSATCLQASIRYGQEVTAFLFTKTAVWASELAELRHWTSAFDRACRVRVRCRWKWLGCGVYPDRTGFDPRRIAGKPAAYASSCNCLALVTRRAPDIEFQCGQRPPEGTSKRHN